MNFFIDYDGGVGQVIFVKFPLESNIIVLCINYPQ